MQSYRLSENVRLISHCLSSSRLKIIRRFGLYRFSTTSVKRFPNEPVPPVTRMFRSLSIFSLQKAYERSRSCYGQRTCWSTCSAGNLPVGVFYRETRESRIPERRAQDLAVSDINRLQRARARIGKRPQRQLEVIDE